MHLATVRRIFTPVLLATLVLAVSVPPANAQPQSKSQQKCINSMNKAGVKLCRTVGKDADSCIKGFFKGQLPGSAQDCLTDDLKGRILKAESKTISTELKRCPLLLQPDFAFTSAAIVNAAAVSEARGLVADVFGSDLDTALTPGNEKCQRKVQKAYEKILKEKLKIFLKCKKDALKLGTSNVVDLANVCMGAIAADTKGKIAKRILKLTDTLIKTCPAPGAALDTLFPGRCVGEPTHEAWSTCIDVEVEGRVCGKLSQMDGFAFDCDLFDDGVVCNDGETNGDETDVDCGGLTCPTCPDLSGCNLGTDCQSGVCVGNICQPASCSDGVLNGTETDIDCGGSCTGCLLGETCIVGGDCVSTSCAGSACTCGNMAFTFNISSNNGGVFDSAEWPGGTQNQATSDPGCNATINVPGGNIDLVCSLQTEFSINSFSGFSSCFGTGGPNGDGCEALSCPPAGIPSCCPGIARPSCSAALNGSGSARYLVQCLD